MFYVDRGECGFESLLRAGLVAAHSVIVSYDVRRFVCVEAYARLEGCRWARLVVDGSRVRGLSVQEPALEGLLRSLLRGDRWPGLLLETVQGPREPSGCVSVADILGGSIGGCPGCVYVEPVVGVFTAWWAAAAAMVALDERCGGCGRSG